MQKTVRTAVRGHCVYQDIRTPTVSDQFDNRQEPKNEEDMYAVVVYEDSESTDVVGHFPRDISGVSYFFLEHDNSITSKVTDKRRHSRQKGGMEIPYELTYREVVPLLQSFQCIYRLLQFFSRSAGSFCWMDACLHKDKELRSMNVCSHPSDARKLG